MAGRRTEITTEDGPLDWQEFLDTVEALCRGDETPGPSEPPGAEDDATRLEAYEGPVDPLDFFEVFTGLD